MWFIPHLNSPMRDWCLGLPRSQLEPTAFAKRNAAVSELPYVIGVFTVAFGAGQVIGPVLSGIISDNSGSLFNGLIWGCFFLGAGVVLPLFQKDRLAH